MKTLSFIVFVCILTFSCNTTSRKEENPKNEPTIKTEKTLVTENPGSYSKVSDCGCETKEYNRSYTTDLAFRNAEYSKVKNDSLFAKWSNDSLKNKVRSIRFSGYDTIPSKYSVFKEVDRISISSINGIHGVDMFPKLNTVHFYGSKINLGTGEKWLQRVEALFSLKTEFIGLETFTKMKNLQVISIDFSGFDNFPKDFDKLECLQEVSCRTYMYGEIDLNTLDITKNKCLQKVEFKAKRNTLSGIPKGINDPKIQYLKIIHRKLTEKDKEALKQIKASGQEDNDHHHHS